MRPSAASKWWERHLAGASALVAAAIGAAALIGWFTGNPLLLGLHERYIPMAPNTAIGFVVLGAALLAIGDRRARWASGAAAVGVAVVCLLRLSEYVTGVDRAVDAWFLDAPAETLNLAPVGKMALSTALAFVVAGGATAALAGRAGRVAGHVAGCSGLAVTAAGLVFVLGYGFNPGAPLLYGTGAIPMALNTALGFVAIGTGLVAAAGRDAFPAALLSGPSIRARLLRVFLPLVVGTVLVVCWTTHALSTAVSPSSATIGAAALATTAILLFGLICARIAGVVGERIERAEAELRRAHDLLERKVEERTAELSGALADLRRAHDELQRAHHELQQTQVRMLQQAKMASLGRTAAGVAHEINNPLAFVTNNMAILKREVTSIHEILDLYRRAEQTLSQYQHELHDEIRDLCEAVDLPYILDNLDRLLDRSREGLRRIQKIVQDLRDFAHLDEADYQDADLNAGVIATTNIMRSLADEVGVALETDLGPIPHLLCYPAKINLVIQNLVANAIDACCAGGRIVVGTRPLDDGVEIEVRDTGCGVDPAIAERIFDPFFTTKTVGRGTGLGLSMSYGIVKDHGGTIACDSEPGRGARFTVRLPRTPPRPPGAGSDGTRLEPIGTLGGR